MAREIVVWCDPCLKEDTRTAATEVTITLGGAAGKAKTLAVCDAHNDQYVKPLQALLDEFGQAVAKEAARPKVGRLDLSSDGPRHGYPPAAGRPNQCLWCELQYSQTGGFPRHLKVTHGFAGLVEAFGGPCPVCGEGPFEAIAAHAKRNHPELPGHTTAPFEWARDNGDPFGIYAATIAKKGSLDPDEAFEEVRASEDRGRRKKGK